MEKTMKDHLIATLKRLKKEELDHFKDKLAEKEFNGNSIGAGQLENASVIKVADRIVRLFTKKSAASITVEVLNDIGQNQRKTGAGPAVNPSSDVTGASTSVGDKVASGRSLHFVDRHRTDLIQRVTVVLNVCDYLLEDRLLIQEQYDNILALKPASVQMRKLYECSRAWGDEEKDRFLEILKKTAAFSHQRPGKK